MPKRTVRSIDQYLTPEEIYFRFIEFDKPESMSDKTYLRYQALIALVYSSGLRISDVIRLKRSQFNFKADREFVIVENVAVNKRRKDPIKIEIPLPRVGVFKPFTDVIIQHYKKRRGKELMFPLTRSGAYKAIRKATGKWCHYFRSQDFSYMVNTVRNVFAVARMKGVKNPQSLEPYYRSTWKDHRESLKK